MQETPLVCNFSVCWGEESIGSAKIVLDSTCILIKELHVDFCMSDIEVKRMLMSRCIPADYINYKIFNYPKVLKAFLELKQTHEALEDGSFVLEVKDHGRMKIQVKDGVVSVTETSDAPDWSLSDTEAVRFLTSPEALYRNVIPKAVPGNWFPLSFGMSPLDEF